MAATAKEKGKEIMVSPDGNADDLSAIFPGGLRVLLVDDNNATLNAMRLMLQECHYHVTACIQAQAALSVLRENKGEFDVVLTDLHMPGMNGLELLEVIRHEMDIPVVLMSGDSRTNDVMTGVQNGACDYLIKPVRLDQLKTIWKHAARKKWPANKEQPRSLEESEHTRQVTDNTNYDPPVKDGSDISGTSKREKRDTVKNDNHERKTRKSSAKKPRLVWSADLHQKFIDAINELGLDKVVPLEILKLMNDPRVKR